MSGLLAVCASTLVLGFVGSVHCFGMCGGLAAAFTQASGSVAPRRQALILSAGRISSYAVAGCLAGGIGGFAERIARALALAPPMRSLIGILVACLGLILVFRPLALSSLEGVGYAFWRRVMPRVHRVGAPGRGRSSLLLGLAWGWLPCGLVYSALLVAAASRDAATAGLAMACFGLGTLPAVLGASGVGALAHRFGRSGGLRLRRAAGGLLVLFGLWSIAAGTQLAPLHSDASPKGTSAACHDVPRPAHADPGNASHAR